MKTGAFFERAFGFDAAVARLAQRRSPGLLASLIIGVGFALLVLAIRWILNDLYGSVTGFMILLPAVILAALTAGGTSGLAACVVCLVGGWWIVGPYTAGSGIDTPLGRVATINFIVVGLFCTGVAASLRKTLIRLEQSRRALESSTALYDRSEALTKAMVDQAAAGIARIDADGRVVSLNARYAEMLGLDPEKAVGISTDDATHPDDVMATRALLAQVAAGGPGGQLEKRYVRPDGTTVWALLSLRAMIDGAGRPEGYIAVLIDISDAKLAEAALRESEERFRLMADTAPSPVWLTNADGEVEFVNEALVEFYGRPASDIMGHVWKQAIHPDDAEAVAQVQAGARPAHRAYGFECRFQRADGVWRWMQVSVNPRFDTLGVFCGYVGMSFDVTEARDALEALARQERRQTFLLSLTDRLRSIRDSDTLKAEVSAALAEVLDADRIGYGEIDAVEQTLTIHNPWTRQGVPDLSGVWPLAEFSPGLVETLSQGIVARIPDLSSDPRTRAAAGRFAGAGVRAMLDVPLMRAGQLRAILFVHSATPRVWTEAEFALVSEVAERTWLEIERTRAEAEVRESEERFRAIADTAPVLIWVTAQDRTRAFVNQAYVAYNGGSYEEARQADWRAVVHPEDHDRIITESLAGEATGEPFSMEARYLRHDGEYRWLKSFSRPRMGAGGQVLGFVGVAFDVTDIREAQGRLAESEARFRTVADSAPALIWMADDLGRVTFGNRRYRTFFTIRKNEDLADGWRRYTHIDDQDVFSQAFLRAFSARDRFEALVRVQHPQLGLRWLRTEGVPRFDSSGAFQGYVGASLDVTEAKQAEDDLKRINELLEERVGEALAEKAKAEADLMHAQRMEAVGRLTGGVAHDFNNLLTVVIGALDLILKSPDDAARRKKLGEAALSAARRGESLTHQLLAFSRRQALRPEAIDLNGQIRESEPLLRRAVGEAVEFKLKLRRGGARVSVDPAQFEAALLNLIVNARDAVGDKAKGRITVQTMSCEVKGGEVAELGPGQYVCVTVSDNGAGMASDVITRVFEPFFTTKSVGKGTGLGLSQVYGFARQSGGGVHISSTVGRGTEIKLYLPPLALNQTLDPAEDHSDGRRLPSGRRLLLVEDDVGVAAIALDLLETMGLEVRAVETGDQALDILATDPERFDVMLTDVVMPGGMTGIQLARACADLYPDMAVILTSGYAGDDVDQALADAPWPFVRKPYSGEQLRAVLERILPLGDGEA